MCTALYCCDLTYTRVVSNMQNRRCPARRMIRHIKKACIKFDNNEARFDVKVLGWEGDKAGQVWEFDLLYIVHVEITKLKCISSAQLPRLWLNASVNFSRAHPLPGH